MKRKTNFSKSIKENKNVFSLLPFCYLIFFCIDGSFIDAQCSIFWIIPYIWRIISDFVFVFTSFYLFFVGFQSVPKMNAIDHFNYKYTNENVNLIETNNEGEKPNRNINNSNFTTHKNKKNKLTMLLLLFNNNNKTKQNIHTHCCC